MLAKPFLLNGHGFIPTVAGSVLVVLALWIFLRRLREFVRERNPSALAQLQLVILGFAILYALGTAVGRLTFGIQYAQQSRYVVFTNLFLFGFYLEAVALGARRLRAAVLTLFCAGLLVANFYPSHRDRAMIEYFATKKTAWKQCYLQQHNISVCDRVAGATPYPDREQTGLQQKLDYLQRNRLNLFSGQ
jgi:hypothetical protein